MWKKEYEDSRRRKAQQDPEYAERLRSRQSRTPEENKIYMAAYYRKNPSKFRRTPEQQAKYNARRRAKYAEDADYRERQKATVRAYWQANPLLRKNQRLRKHGIALSDYQDLLRSQNGRCAICGYSDLSDPKMFPIVDHDHKTGAVRGLLCSNCNFGIGSLKDDVEILLSAIQYLSFHGSSGWNSMQNNEPWNELLGV